MATSRGDEEGLLDRKLADSILPRKAACGALVLLVPKTDTGGWGENPKARERTLVKELGKLTP